MQNLLRPFTGALRSRARKSAENKIHAYEAESARPPHPQPSTPLTARYTLTLRLSVSAMKN